MIYKDFSLTKSSSIWLVHVTIAIGSKSENVPLALVRRAECPSSSCKAGNAVSNEKLATCVRLRKYEFMWTGDGISLKAAVLILYKIF